MMAQFISLDLRHKDGSTDEKRHEYRPDAMEGRFGGSVLPEKLFAEPSEADTRPVGSVKQTRWRNETMNDFEADELVTLLGFGSADICSTRSE